MEISAAITIIIAHEEGILFMCLSFLYINLEKSFLFVFLC